MKLNNSFKLSTLMLGVLALVTSCGSGIEDKATTAGYTGCKTVSCYTNAITDAQWAAALAAPVDLTMKKLEAVYTTANTGTVTNTAGSAAVVGTGTSFTTELVVGGSIKIGADTKVISAITDNLNLTLTTTITGANTGALYYKVRTGKDLYEFSSTKFASPTDDTLTFETGKPYVFKFTSPYSATETANNNQQHYFTSEGFWSSIAVKKIETTAATYNVPYLNDFELNEPTQGGVNRDKVAYIYFVPVKTGTWGAVCKEGNHGDSTLKTGMYATVRITGTPNLPLDFEIASDFDTALGNPLEPRKVSSTDAYKTLWGGTITSSTAQAGTVTNTAASASVVGTGTAFTTALAVGGSITIGGSTKIISAIASDTALTLTTTLTSANTAVSYYKATVIANTVNTAGSTATMTEAAPGTTGFSDFNLTKDSGYVLRFTKAAGVPTGTYTLNSSFFRKGLVRKIQDQDVQLKPYYLNSIVFNPMAVGTAVSTTAPGAGEVDFWISPTELGTFNFDFADKSVTPPVTTTSRITVQ
jgi:hypothetical protein